MLTSAPPPLPEPTLVNPHAWPPSGRAHARKNGDAAVAAATCLSHLQQCQRDRKDSYGKQSQQRITYGGSIRAIQRCSQDGGPP